MHHRHHLHDRLHRHPSARLHRRSRASLRVALLLVLALCAATLTASRASAHEPAIAPVDVLMVGDVRAGSFDVSWFRPQGADRSRLAVATDPAMRHVVWQRTSRDEHPQVVVGDGLDDGTTYYVQVTPAAGDRDGPASYVQGVTTPLRPPDALATVDVSRVGTGGFTLRWTDVAATGYRVVASAHADLADPFLDTTLAYPTVEVAVPRDGARYYASVTPVRGELPGAPTVLSVAVPLARLGAVHAPVAVPASGGALDVRWAAVTNATSYTVSVSGSEHGKARWTSAPTTATTLRTAALRAKALRGVVWVRVTADRHGRTRRTSAAAPTVRVAGEVTGKAALVLHVASYNLLEPKYSTPDGDSWRQRFKAEGKALRGYDVVGVQEAPASYGGGSPQAVLARASGLTRATHPGSGRACSAGKVQLLYDAGRFDLRRCGTVSVSVSKRDQPRAVTWAVLRDRRTGRSVFVADTHLTAHVVGGSSATSRRDRLRQARKVAAAIARKNTRHLPVILVGDLNSDLGSRTTPVDVLADAGLADGALTAVTRVGTQWDSYHGFRRTARDGHHLDHVLTSAGTRVLKFSVDRTHERRAPSDHHRVSATVAIG